MHWGSFLIGLLAGVVADAASLLWARHWLATHEGAEAEVLARLRRRVEAYTKAHTN